MEEILMKEMHELKIERGIPIPEKKISMHAAIRGALQKMNIEFYEKLYMAAYSLKMKIMIRQLDPYEDPYEEGKVRVWLISKR